MKRFLLIVLAFASLATFAVAQESRSTLTGRVTDSTGAILPQAQIEVTNLEMGTKTKIQTNKAGDYTVPFLLPGHYAVSATMKGFKTYEHSGLTLQTEQTVTENIVLSVGKVDETMTVYGDTPLIDTATANTGQELTAEEVEDLPSNGRSPLGYAHLEYGAVSKGKHSESQTTPFGNSTADDFSLGGGSSGSNELLLNGVPNMEDGSRTAGYSPELDAVNAVHVDEFSANADLGDTSGGIVNITTKSGTNDFHGSASDYYNGSRPFTAEPFFTPKGATVTSTHFSQYGATIGGPVIIPHVLHGRDKLFFFYAMEGYVGNAPNTTTTSVPTAAERQGDFSALLALNSSTKNYQLYNPYAATLGKTGIITRAAVPNNCLTATSSYCATAGNAGLTLSPVAAAYFAMMPLPNYTGASTTADGENNYYADDPTHNNYKSYQGRIDYAVSESNKIFVEGHRSNYVTTASDIFKTPLSGTTSYIVLEGGQVDDIHVFAPTLSLETRLGFSRYDSWGGPNSLGISPTSMGFQGYLAANSTALAIPYLTFSDASGIPSLSANPSNTEFFDNIQFFSSLNKSWGRHTFKFGPDIRSNKDSAVSPGAANGTFAFKAATEDPVTASPNSATLGLTQNMGGAFAMFDLGLPTSGSYAINKKYQYDNWYLGFFAQDDWKALPNLTVSIGVRVEHETPLVESNNQMVQNWNPALTNVSTAPSEAAYAAAPNANLQASAFLPTGGVVYATSGNRTPYSTAVAYLSPRIGFSYAPAFAHGTMAIRGGAGIYVNPFGDYSAGNSYGFSQTSTMVTSNNNYLTPATTVDDPFPTTSSAANYNPIQPPLGSYFGVNTNLGSSIGYQAQVHVPYAEKWTLDVQKQFGKNWVTEIGYIGTEQVHNSFNNNVGNIPLLPYYSHTQVGNSPSEIATAALMSTTLNNPLKGTMPSYTSAGGVTVANTTSLNTKSTISVAQLLQAYPEYSGVTANMTPGVTNNFEALLFRLSKRMSQGLEFSFNYEHSRLLGGAQLNAGGPLVHSETTSDFPNHASVTAMYKFPFGKNQMFLNNSTLLDEAIGGWELTSIYQFLSGTPYSWGNVNYTGNFKGFANNPHDSTTPSFNTAGFDTVTADQPGTYNYRTFPQYLLRSDPTNNFDFSILKNFTIWERCIVQPRVDAFNAMNRHQLNSSPNLTPTSSAFGMLTGQLNSGRSLQGGVHILF